MTNKEKHRIVVSSYSHNDQNGVLCLQYKKVVCLLVWAFVSLVGAIPVYAQKHAIEENEKSKTQAFVGPKLIGQVEAIYPPEAFEKNIEATVGLLLYIDADGNVVDVNVDVPAKEAGFSFDKNAQAAFKKVKFSPATQDGVPIAVKIRVGYDFKIRFENPVLIEFVDASYPEAALRAGITDSVIAELMVDHLGKVTAVTVTESPRRPEYGFEPLAIEAMSKFKFMPATKNQTPVPVTVTYQYNFVLPPKWVPPSKQPVNLKILLKERGTRKPVPSGFISLKKENAPPIEETFEDGIYSGRGLSPGLWEILIEADGYETITTKEEVLEGKVVTAAYLVERDSYDVLDQSGTGVEDGQYVYETRETKFEKEVSVQNLKIAEVQRVPGNNGDAIKVVQNLPGVSRSTFNTGAIIIRGCGPADTNVLLDGTPIPMIYHFGGLSSTVNSDALSEINFLPGNFSVKYGRAMGGVIDVRTRRPNKDKFTGYFDIDVFDGSLLLEGPIYKNLSFFTSVRRSWVDSILKLIPADEEEGEQMNMTTAPRYWDYQARLNWYTGSGNNVNPMHELEFMFYGSDDKMALVEQSSSTAQEDPWRFELNTRFHNVKFKWHIAADTVENQFTYDIGQERNYANMESDTEEKIVLNHALRDEFTQHLSKWFSVASGVDMHIEQYRVNVNAPYRGIDQFVLGEMPPMEGMSDGSMGGVEDSDNFESEKIVSKENGTRFMPAIFSSLQFRPTDKFNFELGGRMDYDSMSDDLTVDVRGSARFNLNSNLSFKGGVGTFHQPPEERNLSKKFGNPNLKSQYAVHYSLGAEGRLPFYQALSLDVTGFYKSLDNLVVPSTTLVAQDGNTTPERFNNAGKGRVYGAEFMLRHRLVNNFYGWASYTLSRSQRKLSKMDAWHLYAYDQTHILTLLGSYKLPRNIRLGLRFRFVTGTPYTPLSTGVFDSDVENYEPVRGPKNSARNPAYHQLDVRIDKDWIFDYWILTGYIDVQNVYFHANTEMSHYSYDYSSRDGIKGLPILPSVGIRGAF